MLHWLACEAWCHSSHHHHRTSGHCTDLTASSRTPPHCPPRVRPHVETRQHPPFLQQLVLSPTHGAQEEQWLAPLRQLLGTKPCHPDEHKQHLRTVDPSAPQRAWHPHQPSQVFVWVWAAGVFGTSCWPSQHTSSERESASHPQFPLTHHSVQASWVYWPCQLLPQADQKPLTYALSTPSDQHTPRQIRHLDYISQFTLNIKGHSKVVSLDCLKSAHLDVATETPFLPMDVSPAVSVFPTTAAAPRVTRSGCHVHWPDCHTHWLFTCSLVGEWCSGTPEDILWHKYETLHVMNVTTLKILI